MFRHRCASLRLLAAGAISAFASVAPSLAATGPAAAPSYYAFGSVRVGSSSPQRTVTVTVTRAGIVEGISALLQGAPGPDYTSPGGTCATHTSYSVGQTCTVAVVFAPQVPGTRSGAVVLADHYGNTLGTTYLGGTGLGAWPTFPAGAPTLVARGIGNMGVAVNAQGTVYTGFSGETPTLLRQTAGGSWTTFVTLPAEYADAQIKALDGAGNLVLTAPSAFQVLRIDPAGNLRVVATMPVQPPFLRQGTPGGLAVSGTGDIYVGTSDGFIYKISPTGALQVAAQYADGSDVPPAIYGVALDSANGLYVNAYGVINTPTDTFLTNAASMAVDASKMLWLGQPNASRSDDPCPNGGACHPGDPRLSPSTETPYQAVMAGAQGDIYVVAPAGNQAGLFVLNRVQPHGIVFAADGLNPSNGSFALSNAGNTPLDLSRLKLQLGGATPDRFNVEHSTCGTSLAPAATCTVRLTFTPSAEFPFVTSGALLLTGLPGTENKVVPLEGFPNQ